MNQNICWNWKQKRVVSISNRIKYNLLDYYLNLNTIVEFHKNREGDKIDSIQKVFKRWQCNRWNYGLKALRYRLIKYCFLIGMLRPCALDWHAEPQLASKDVF